MKELTVTPAEIARFDLELPIRASAETVWSLMTDRINDWWMPDFRALGEGSTVTLSATTGGGLVEALPDGLALEWYRVQMVIPGEAIYLVGYMAPDWGGPTISMLKLAIKPDDDGCILAISDALTGNVTAKSAASAKSGWQTLFGNLKAFAEA